MLFRSEQNNALANIVSSSQTAINLAAMTGVISSSTKNQINSIKAVNTNLADYVTGRALDGVFTKIEDEEYKIRTDISARVTDLLKDVFGQLD